MVTGWARLCVTDAPPPPDCYVPELVFGQLLTGSNFDDSRAEVTGGRHGYGAKLTNIFSHEFTVETLDSQAGLLYKQSWRNNMGSCDPPEIVPVEPGTHDYTRVTFKPDLKRACRACDCCYRGPLLGSLPPVHFLPSWSPTRALTFHPSLPPQASASLPSMRAQLLSCAAVSSTQPVRCAACV